MKNKFWNLINIINNLKKFINLNGKCRSRKIGTYS